MILMETFRTRRTVDVVVRTDGKCEEALINNDGVKSVTSLYQKALKKCGFFPHLPDPPPKEWKHILGDKKFFPILPENDLPTPQNSMK